MQRRPKQIYDPGDVVASPDSLNASLIAFLGVMGGLLAIVSVVSGSFVLGMLVGAVAIALAGVGTWQALNRRRMTKELIESRAEVRRLETELADQVKGDRSAPEPGSPPPDRLTREVMAARPADVSGDPETGLLGEDYFGITLSGRVASARRHLRPLSLILIDAITGLGEDNMVVADPATITGVILETLRDADTVCRLTNGRFALILEDTPENGAIWTVERIRRRINEEVGDVTVWAGVACYPAHGFDGPEVHTQASKAIEAARDWYQDRTEVADS